MNINDRINERMKLLSIRQVDLVNLTGATKGSVNQWVNNRAEPGKKFLIPLCHALRCKPDWLLSGAGLPELEDSDLNNVSDGPIIRTKIPIISWVQAGDWSEIIDNFQPGNADEYLPCPVSCSPETFALRVRGESMFPDYKNNDIIFVDPKQNAENGDDVVVRLESDAESTFKRLVIEGDKRYLKAVNAAWPTPIIEVNDEATICGVVIFSGTIRK